MAEWPRLIFWEATAGCNLECRHCRRLEVAKALSRRDLDTARVKTRLIDALAEAGRPVLVCSGGEPLLRPDLFELAGYARERGVPVALATNGTLVDEAMADRIAAAGFERVAISLDGAEAATHDAFRQQAGAFDAAVEGIRRLRRRGMSVQINSTVTKHNQDQLPQIYALAIALGADAWHVFMFVPVGCGLDIPAEQQLAAESYERLLTWLAAQSAQRKLFVRATCAPQYFRILAQTRSFAAARGASKFASLTKGCLAGTGIAFVSHTGEVFPCGYLPVSSGNITQRRFAEIWQDSVIFQGLREPDALGGKCGACDYKRICSGCRARAYAQTGDWLAEEPCCAYQPAQNTVSR